jgi:uroporphyrinogen-III synthase
MEMQNWSEKTIGIVDNPKNKKLISNLEKQGNKIILFPEPKTLLIKSEFDICSKINDFDWLIFTDLHSVDYFLQLLEESDINFFELDALRICALGEAVADRLRFQQLHSDVIPANNRASSVISALNDYIFNEAEFYEMKFLIIKESSAEFEIFDLLSEKKADVTKMTVYESSFQDSARLPKLKALVKGGGMDEFIFTAPEDVFNISQLFKNENLGKVFTGVKISTNDEITRQTFIEHQ